MNSGNNQRSSKSWVKIPLAILVIVGACCLSYSVFNPSTAITGEELTDLMAAQREIKAHHKHIKGVIGEGRILMKNTEDAIAMLAKNHQTKAKIKEAKSGIENAVSTVKENIDWSEKVERQLVSPRKLERSFGNTGKFIRKYKHSHHIASSSKIMERCRNDLKRDYKVMSAVLHDIKTLTDTTMKDMQHIKKELKLRKEYKDGGKL